MDADQPISQITTDYAGGVLTVTGEVDLLTADEFRSALLAAQDAGDLVVDLRGVGFMDSSGLRALLETRRRAEEAGVAMALAVSPGSPVDRLLDLAGVAGLFETREP